jgi:anti-anti-sigma factor
MDRLHVIETTEVDRATCEQFRDELQLAVQAFWDDPPTGDTLVIDLREVRFIDSSGIRALVEAESSMQENGGRLQIVAEAGIVRRTLEVTGVWEHLHGSAGGAA